VHKVRFRVDSDNDSHWLFYGVVGRAYTGYTNTSGGYVGADSVASWGWSSAGGSNPKTYPNYTTYGTTAHTGDIVDMTIDMGAHTITYGLNGSTFGVGHYNIASEVAIACTTYDTGDQITLLSGEES